MLSIYPACFFHDEDGYSVVFPDLNWLSTCGETLDEALQMSVDCLAGYLYTEEKFGKSIPKPSSPEEINIEEIARELDPDTTNSVGFVNMVSVDVASYAKEHFEKSIKKTLSIPSWLNKAALEQNINFSQVLQEALIVKLSALSTK